MSPRDVFGIIVRTIGLIVLLYDCTFFGWILFGPFPLGFLNFVGVLIAFAVAAFVGLWLLRGAPPLMRFAYPPDEGSAAV